jgi:nucleoside 2-deoxyribosyltransferase
MGGRTMKRVYVAGPYSADNVLDVLRNIGKGEKTCAMLFTEGFAPFCPWHDKSYVIDMPNSNFTVEQFYEFSIAWLKVSDAVFLLPNWTKSKGTVAEVKIAEELGLPMFTELTKLIRWRNGV